MIILNNSMSNEDIIELLNSSISSESSREEIVPKGVKARRIFWNSDVGKWYGVDSSVYRSGEKVRVNSDQLLVGNLPKRCFSKTRGFFVLRPEIYDNLMSLKKTPSIIPERVQEMPEEVTEDARSEGSLSLQDFMRQRSERNTPSEQDRQEMMERRQKELEKMFEGESDD